MGLFTRRINITGVIASISRGWLSIALLICCLFECSKMVRIKCAFNEDFTSRSVLAEDRVPLADLSKRGDFAKVEFEGAEGAKGPEAKNVTLI